MITDYWLFPFSLKNPFLPRKTLLLNENKTKKPQTHLHDLLQMSRSFLKKSGDGRVAHAKQIKVIVLPSFNQPENISVTHKIHLPRGIT